MLGPPLETIVIIGFLLERIVMLGSICYVRSNFEDNCYVRSIFGENCYFRSEFEDKRASSTKNKMMTKIELFVIIRRDDEVIDEVEFCSFRTSGPKDHKTSTSSRWEV